MNGAHDAWPLHDAWRAWCRAHTPFRANVTKGRHARVGIPDDSNNINNRNNRNNWLVGWLSGVGGGEAKSPILYISTPDRPPQRLLLVLAYY